MRVNKLKLQSHNLINSIRDKKTLELLCSVLYSVSSKLNNKGDWWDDLTEKQKFELEQSILESDDPKNLIAHDEVIKQAKLKSFSKINLIAIAFLAKAKKGYCYL